MATFELAYKYAKDYEVGGSKNGGLVNDPDDKGGLTKWGISKRFLDEAGIKKTNLEIINMTESEAMDIYNRCFWSPNSYAKIRAQYVANYVYDSCVNHGAKMANKMLQRCANKLDAGIAKLKEDGVIGINTLTYIDRCNQMHLLREMQEYRENFYMKIIERDPTQAKFKRGWLRRAKGEPL